MDFYGAGFAKYNKRTQKFKHGSKLFLDNRLWKSVTDLTRSLEGNFWLLFQIFSYRKVKYISRFDFFQHIQITHRNQFFKKPGLSAENLQDLMDKLLLELCAELGRTKSGGSVTIWVKIKTI